MYEAKNDFRSYLEQGLYLKHYGTKGHSGRKKGAKDKSPRKIKVLNSAGSHHGGSTHSGDHRSGGSTKSGYTSSGSKFGQKSGDTDKTKSATIALRKAAQAYKKQNHGLMRSNALAKKKQDQIKMKRLLNMSETLSGKKKKPNFLENAMSRQKARTAKAFGLGKSGTLPDSKMTAAQLAERAAREGRKRKVTKENMRHRLDQHRKYKDLGALGKSK